MIFGMIFQILYLRHVSKALYLRGFSMIHKSKIAIKRFRSSAPLLFKPLFKGLFYFVARLWHDISTLLYIGKTKKPHPPALEGGVFAIFPEVPLDRYKILS